MSNELATVEQLAIEDVKRCTRCTTQKPRSSEWFSPNKRTRDGLDSWCRECRRIYRRELHQRNHQRDLAYTRQYREENRAIVLERTKQWAAHNPHYYRDWKRQRAEQSREYAAAYRQKNPEYQRQWSQANRDKVNAKSHRYRARKRSLPAIFTEEHWLKALEYFNGCCAVCGRQLTNLFKTHFAAMDHWIPINSPECPGTVPTNIVPLCGGKDGCNNHKLHRDPAEWLATDFGKQFAKRKLIEIEAFFRYMETI